VSTARPPQWSLTAVANHLRALDKATARRQLIAFIGPPGAGKSTVVDQLATLLGTTAAVVPMDGFHLDDEVLTALGRRQRKGAPDTFDVGGLAATLSRLRQNSGTVAIPVFDRSLEISRAGARLIEPHHRTLLVEGNYLLLQQTPWTELAALFDWRVLVTTPEPILRRRLLKRWQALPSADAAAKVNGNDLPNAQLVLTASTATDVIIDTS
jgi:pantothenate kinase